MSMDFSGRQAGTSPTDAEGVLFPADPAWDRSKKRRGGAAKTPARIDLAAEPVRRPPEPRSFATETAATVTPSTLAAEETVHVADPVTAPRTTQARKSGPSPAVMALALGAVVILGGVGLYAMQPHDGGVAKLTPGEPAATDIAALPVAPAANDVDVATNTLPARTATTTPAPAAAPARMARQSAPVPAARVRPPTSRAATGSSSDASAVMPDGPKPYTVLNPSAPTQVTPPPAAPATTEVTPPAAIPTTPPVQLAPAPTETAPTPETPPSA